MRFNPVAVLFIVLYYPLFLKKQIKGHIQCPHFYYLNNFLAAEPTIRPKFTNVSINLHTPFKQETLIAPPLISYNSNAGSSCSDLTIFKGHKVGSLCKPTKKGYTFAGWSHFQGYQQIISLTGTGTQYINTGITPNNPKVECKLKGIKESELK